MIAAICLTETMALLYRRLLFEKQRLPTNFCYREVANRTERPSRISRRKKPGGGSERARKNTRRIARYEDAGHGKCHLHQPEIAQLVQDSLLEGHEVKYRLIAWCIMPNHVHLLIKQSEESKLSKIIQRWKGSSARRDQSCSEERRKPLGQGLLRPSDSRRRPLLERDLLHSPESCPRRSR